MEERIEYLYKQTPEEFEWMYSTDNLTHYGDEDNIKYNYLW